MKYITNFFVWLVAILILDILLSVNNFILIGVWIELFVPFNIGINTHLVLAQVARGGILAVLLVAMTLILTFFSELILLRIGIKSWWGRIMFNLVTLLVLTAGVDLVVFGSWNAVSSLIQSFSLY